MMVDMTTMVADHKTEATRPNAVGPPHGTGRIKELDGIRAIAIISVLIAHALGVPSEMPALHALRGVNAFDWVIVGHLWLGVDLFFVLSGFLITGILLETRLDTNYFQNFYVRRGLRILPVLVLVLAIIAAIYHGPVAYFALALLFCANFAAYLNIGTPPGAGPLWSLGVEEQFYLFWPVVIRRLVPAVALWVAAAIVVLVPCLRLLSPDPSRDLLLTWMRCDGLALGALIATGIHIVKPNRRSALLPIAALVAGAIAVRAIEWLLGVEHISRALRPTEADLVFGAAILAAYGFRGSKATAFLRSRPATFVAGTSYCAYVIHLSIFNAVDALGWTASASTLMSGCLRVGWSVPIIFTLAALSKRFLEDPFLSLRAKLAPRLSA